MSSKGTSNRGLASADEETKERVARAGGTARAQNPQGLAEAGRKGGQKVVRQYGPEHMAEIGRKGGASSRQNARD
jgi:general stress protein YciG